MIDISDLPVGTEIECRYIPLSDVKKYEDEGWDVDALAGNHGAYSALATRVINKSKGKIMTVIEEIAAERKRQIDVEGWTPEHDDQHDCGELAEAAAAYAHSAGKVVYTIDPPPGGWPWSLEWWKPKSRRRDLIRAAALIVADIERLDRISA